MNSSPPPLMKNAGPAVYWMPCFTAVSRSFVVWVPVGSLIQMKKPPSGLLISTSVPSRISHSPLSMASRLAIDVHEPCHVRHEVLAHEERRHARDVRVDPTPEEE